MNPLFTKVAELLEEASKSPVQAPAVAAPVVAPAKVASVSDTYRRLTGGEELDTDLAEDPRVADALQKIAASAPAHEAGEVGDRDDPRAPTKPRNRAEAMKLADERYSRSLQEAVERGRKPW